MKKRVIGGIIGLLAFLIVSFIPPYGDLTVMQMRGIGVFVCAIVWWMTTTFDDYIVALIMAAAWVALGVIPVGKAMSGFSSSTIWILIGAMGLAAAAQASGLLKRIALEIMNKFPLSYKGQILAQYVAGMVLSPLIPSTNARLVVMAPLTKMISDQMGYGDKSKGASGLFSAMWFGQGAAGQATFLTGSSVGFIILGLMPVGIGKTMGWTSWLMAALPWGLTVLVLGMIAMLIFYKPEQKQAVTRNMIKEELVELGKMSKAEKICAGVIAFALILWMTESLHGINAAAVSICAMAILLGTGILNRKSVRSGIPWDAVLFIGVLIGISGVFKELGINDITSALLGPILQPLLNKNIFLFIPVVSCLVYLTRFILPSQVACVTIFTVLLAPFAIEAGIHPWIMGFIAYVGGNIFAVMYQNVTYVTAFYAANNGEMVVHKDILVMAITYCVVSIIGLMISVPFWHLMGFFNI